MTAPNQCPECGATYERRQGRGANRQLFCTDEHKRAFYNLMSKRGRVAMALFSTAARGRRGASDLVTYARKQLYALDSLWRREDAAAGRNPALVVTGKQGRAWRAADLA